MKVRALIILATAAVAIALLITWWASAVINLSGTPVPTVTATAEPAPTEPSLADRERFIIHLRELDPTWALAAEADTQKMGDLACEQLAKADNPGRVVAWANDLGLTLRASTALAAAAALDLCGAA